MESRGEKVAPYSVQDRTQSVEDDVTHQREDARPPVGDVGSLATPPQLSVRSLADHVAELATALDESNRLALDRERVVDRLHEENQRLRAGETQQALTPVLRDLVRLFDDLHRSATDYANLTETTPAAAARDLACFRDVVADILYRYGIERYDIEPGSPFDTRVHRAISVVVTDDQTRDRTIARVIRPGFQGETRVLRLLEAEVYRFILKKD